MSPNFPEEAPAGIAVDPEAPESAAESSSIAELLSTLSEPAELPDAASEKPKAFSPDDVDFASGDWLQRTIAVQAWLCLDAPLSPDDPAEVALSRLFSKVAAGRRLRELVELTDFPRLTESGVQRLESFLNRAADLKALFVEELEDGHSRRSATEHWQAEWDEWGAQAKRQPGRIIAEVDTWKIKDFRGYAEEGELQLNPSYQRNEVWSTNESQLLIESILLGIPLPSVILTKESGRDEWQIVDGKQRLTAILRFIGRHPKGREFAAGCAKPELLDSDFKKFAAKNQIKPSTFAERFLPFPLMKYQPGHPLSALSGKYYYEIRDLTLTVGGKAIKIKKIFETEDAHYQIPVILYRDTQIQDIHHVFGLYNRQGRKLNAEELRNAVYHHLYLARLLLYLSGDRNDAASRDRLAKFLPDDVAAGAGAIGDYLETCNFGMARFKRTKVLSWACALMAHLPNPTESNGYATPSTATHIDALLDAISDNGEAHPLYQAPRLIGLSKLLADALALHEGARAVWHPNFKNKDKLDSKWDELSFVASLIACVFLVLAGKADLDDDKMELIRSYTASRLGPKKSQNKTQWGFIAWVVDGLLDQLNVDRATLGPVLMSTLGANALPVFQSLAHGYEADLARARKDKEGAL